MTLKDLKIGGTGKMKIAVASDHGGFNLKGFIIEHLGKRGIETVDLGTDSAESVNYPVYGKKCADYVAAENADLGIVCCGTGIGISIAANKVKGIRCGVCSDTATARLIRQHNDANMISFGARIVGSELAKDIVKAFLTTDFEGGRHALRVDMITDIENRQK